MERNQNNYKPNHIVTLAIFYTCFLILSNVTASKVASVYNLQFTAAIILFPFTYIIGDIMTEVYGFKISRRVIWLSLFANLFFVICTYFICILPPYIDWPHQSSFENVFGVAARILLASAVAYLFGELLNSMILAKLKVYTEGRHFWLRALSGTFVGAAIDTMIFMFIAFYDVLPAFIIWKMVGVEYAIKIIVEIVVLPITYMLVNYLKRTEKIDYYDRQTKFNIFSLKLDS